MAIKAPTVRSVVRRVQPTLQAVSELAVLSASTTPVMAPTRSEATPLNITVGRVKSRVDRVEKGVEKQSISKLAILRKDGQKDCSAGGSVRHDRDGETKESGQGQYPLGPGTTHLRGQAAGVRQYACRLQHPEGVDTPVGLQQINVPDLHPTPVLESTSPESPVLLALVGPRTPPDTPPQPIVSERDPLGLMDPPRIPSPRMAHIIGQRWKALKEYRPATREWEEAGLLPGAKPVDAAP